ncbi:superoxide dismutase, Cu-Zn family [Desulfonatronum thiosulfatophilum]|uniref:Superoxide dismutase [Cu-Zn] n=1 Tax=Desulfonatronum thiosulfatophilum TaxID=617002 RepID=A0A1G6DQY1_9BACT|nr:superoxide dismutase family protein [Desulfonatronum thiosulfatophilum]SDB47500.1 superoxide dismutase, Cu-Zn family [Desulfonatronum thiosulfatophilum]
MCKFIGKSLVTILFLLLAVGAAKAENPTAFAELFDNDGKSLGKAHFEQGPNGVLIRLELEGVAESAGFHAIHIHEHGDCTDHEEGFEAAGQHLNPEDKKHGLMHPDGPDAGDFPNIYVHEDGSVRAELFTNYASLDGSVGARMLDESGAAIVIHANPDDHHTQPTGDSGPRIACGTIYATSDIQQE